MLSLKAPLRSKRGGKVNFSPIEIPTQLFIKENNFSSLNYFKNRSLLKSSNFPSNILGKGKSQIPYLASSMACQTFYSSGSFKD